MQFLDDFELFVRVLSSCVVFICLGFAGLGFLTLSCLQSRIMPTGFSNSQSILVTSK